MNNQFSGLFQYINIKLFKSNISSVLAQKFSFESTFNREQYLSDFYLNTSPINTSPFNIPKLWIFSECFSSIELHKWSTFALLFSHISWFLLGTFNWFNPYYCIQTFLGVVSFLLSRSLWENSSSDSLHWTTMMSYVNIRSFVVMNLPTLESSSPYQNETRLLFKKEEIYFSDSISCIKCPYFIRSITMEPKSSFTLSTRTFPFIFCEKLHIQFGGQLHQMFMIAFHFSTFTHP